ncbi:MAG: pseudouridine synthase, partial [Verrucomicrobia bacterium]|nr:pseudouridine synthase [Verrucomicrobiota bacterium]
MQVLHEDPDLLVLNKPAGLVCHPTKDGPASSLIGRVRMYLAGQANATFHLSNRLDRETSGVVLVAKNAGAAGEFGKIWERRLVEKEYLAIVHGFVKAETGLIDAPLGKDLLSAVAIKDCVRPDGAPASTESTLERRFTKDGRA